MIIEALRAAPLFQGLSDADLERLSTMVERQQLKPGDILLREGEAGDAMFIVEEGELEVTKRTGSTDLPIARVGPGAVQGEIAAIEGKERAASVRALTEVRVIRIPREALLALLEAGPDTALALLRTALERLRGLESFARQREKLAGLGTLAAGLAHELNNPAAAIRRSVASLGQAIAERDRIHPPHDLMDIHPSADPAALSALERADAVDEIADLVGGSGAAAALVDAGWSAADLSGAFAGMSPEVARESAAWLAASAKIDALLHEVSMAGDRISEIVGAVKSYAYLDQAPIQRIDIREGLDNTLVILQSKLRAGVDVTRHYADDLPQIEAYGSELNQVWTNLVDNAADAMGGRGAIDIYASGTEGDGVEVKVCDTGPGIPADVLPRLFEPFFTTKPPGVGTGLGLHITNQVVARHGGRIEVEPNPDGGTCFIVTLPPSPPATLAEAPATEEVAAPQP